MTNDALIAAQERFVSNLETQAQMQQPNSLPNVVVPTSIATIPQRTTQPNTPTLHGFPGFLPLRSTTSTTTTTTTTTQTRAQNQTPRVPIQQETFTHKPR